MIKPICFDYMENPPTNWDDLFNFYKQGLFSATIDCSNTYSKKVFLCSDHSVMPVFRNTISLSNATVFIESKSQDGSPAHALWSFSLLCSQQRGWSQKGGEHIWATKGKWDEREGNLSRVGNNGIVGSSREDRRLFCRQSSSHLIHWNS